MTATTTKTPGIPAQQGRPRPLPTRARRPGLIAGAVVLIVGFGLTGAVLVSRAGGTTAVLVAAHPVPAGHVIEAGDLTVAEIAGPLRAIAANKENTVVGRSATVGLVAGQVLNRDMLTAATVPGKDQAVIGLSLAPGQFPADGLTVGDRVLAVVIPAATDPATPGVAPVARAITTAQVFGLHPDETRASDTLVSLLLPLNTAAQVVAEGASGHIGLVKVAAGS